MQRRIFFFFLTILILVIATTLVVFYGRGYRLSFEQDKTKILGTGLLVATSNPDGAQVFINEKLTSATNDTINLTPGNYTVRIVKEGYFPWEKNLKLQKEVVTKTDALLFPIAPKLESLTSTGVSSPILDPTKTRITYKIEGSNSAQKNGIYLLDMGGRPILTLQSSATKVVDDTKDLFSKADLSFSPNGKNLIATTSAKTYLLALDGQKQDPQDVSTTLAELQSQWRKETAEKEAERRANLKSELANILSSSFTHISWSADETKILYQASQSATLPETIKPPIIGANSQPEERELRKGRVYVYDTKEDKNFPINTPIETLQWFPNSRHLLVTSEGEIASIEYDGTNKTTLYAGPFIGNTVFPWPNGSKLVILTNLGNPNIPPNLYTISLR